MSELAQSVDNECRAREKAPEGDTRPDSLTRVSSEGDDPGDGRKEQGCESPPPRHAKRQPDEDSLGASGHEGDRGEDEENDAHAVDDV